MTSAPKSGVLAVLTLLHFATSTSSTTHVYNIHWNSSNPMFRIDNNDNVIDINSGNHPWEYDQVNIVCPVYKPGTDQTAQESYIIYSVTKQEYESCRITQPNPKIVALCDQPYNLMYFTITFRSFTPTPGGLEFRPGHDYYFISTSAKNDLHRRVGGGCSTHNMKVVFRVASSNNEVENEDEYAKNTETNEQLLPKQFPWSQERDFRRTFSYYYPSGEVQLEQQEGRMPKNTAEYNAVKRDSGESGSQSLYQNMFLLVCSGFLWLVTTL